MGCFGRDLPDREGQGHSVWAYLQAWPEPRVQKAAVLPPVRSADESEKWEGGHDLHTYQYHRAAGQAGRQVPTVHAQLQVRCHPSWITSYNPCCSDLTKSLLFLISRQSQMVLNAWDSISFSLIRCGRVYLNSPVKVTTILLLFQSNFPNKVTVM